MFCHVICLVSLVNCQLSSVTCHMSPDTCHMSPVTCQKKYLKEEKNAGTPLSASWLMRTRSRRCWKIWSWRPWNWVLTCLCWGSVTKQQTFRGPAADILLSLSHCGAGNLQGLQRRPLKCNYDWCLWKVQGTGRAHQKIGNIKKTAHCRLKQLIHSLYDFFV